MPTSETSGATAAHQLAAIMFSDIARYTAIMGRDEQEALRALDAHRGVLRTVLPKFNGRLVGEIGDGTLSAFHSAIDAVNCAREVQSIAEDNPELALRIGIHLGDVVFTNNTVLGDGVNVASRIHSLAPPGGICISSSVFDEIRNKPGIRAKDLGERKLKNVARRMRLYQLATADDAHFVTEPHRPLTGMALIASAGVLAAIAVTLTIMRWRTQSSSTLPSSGTIRSIAVLPLDNFSGDPNQEYFADGMTDELTTDLATISALRVISRSSVMQFKGAHRPPMPQIANALNVDAVIEGSVLRAGDRVRITAQLIDARADKHLWAQTYERDSRDVFALQDDLASAIAREINVELTPHEQARLAGTRTVNPAAHEAYLKGRYLLSTPDKSRVEKALELFQQAIAADPTFAQGYAGLADAYSWGEDWYYPPNDAMPKAKAAAEKALQLDPDLAEGHTSLGVVELQYDFDWATAEREFRRAIELNTNYAYAHDQYAAALFFQGRAEEAIGESARATELDPLSAEIWTIAGVAQYGRDFDAGRASLRKALDFDPHFFLPQSFLGWVDLAEGKYDEAIPILETADTMDAPAFVQGWLGYAYGKAGQSEKARTLLDQLKSAAAQRYVTPFAAAMIHLGLGEKDQALDDFEKAYEVRSQMLTLAKIDRIFDPLRSEPRFIELLRKVHLDH